MINTTTLAHYADVLFLINEATSATQVTYLTLIKAQAFLAQC